MFKYIFCVLIAIWLFSCRSRFNKVTNDLSGHELKGQVKKVRLDFLNDKGDSAYCVQGFDSLGFLMQYYCDGSPYGGFELSENYLIRHRVRATSKTKMGGGCSMYPVNSKRKYNFFGNKLKISNYERHKFIGKKTIYFDRLGRKIKMVTGGGVMTYKYTSGFLTEVANYSIIKRKKLYRYKSYYQYDTWGYLIKVANLYYDNGIFRDTVFTSYINDSHGYVIKYSIWSNKDKWKQGGANAYEYDSMGNWTKRVNMDTMGKVTHSSSRTINYYKKG